MAICPHCGKPIALVPAGSGWIQSHKFDSDAPSILPTPVPASGAFDYERRVPARPATWESDFLVPLAQSVVWGIIGGLASLAGPMLAGWPWWSPLPMAGLSMSLAWWLISSDHQRALWIIEKIIQHDIDGDGQIASPPAYGVSVEVKGEKQWQFAHLPGEPIAVFKLAQMVAGGDSFSERTATNAGLTQDEWRRLRDEFVKREWAVWNHPTRRQQGVTLGLRGKSTLRTIAATPPPAQNK